MSFIRKHFSERGAAAVEFALVVPVLLLLIFGMVEFSRLYNVQISLTNAAREGARTMAIQKDAVLARDAVVASAPSVNPPPTNIAISSTCKLGGEVTVTITYSVTLLTGFFGANLPLTGKGVMRCGG